MVEGVLLYCKSVGSILYIANGLYCLYMLAYNGSAAEAHFSVSNVENNRRGRSGQIIKKKRFSIEVDEGTKQRRRTRGRELYYGWKR